MRVEFETAKLAKNRGFNLETLWYFTNKYPTREDFSSNYNGKGIEHWTSQPSQSLLQKWLREIHNIDVDVFRDSEVHFKDEVRWIVKISDWNNIKIFKSSIADLKHPNHWHGIDFKSYEEAMEKGLFNALKFISNDKV